MNIKTVNILLIILFLLFITIFSTSFFKRKHEFMFLIDSSYEEYRFMNEVKSSLNYKKKTPQDVKAWIYKLTALVTSFQSHITSVKVINKVIKPEAIITTQKGEFFYFLNGKLLPPEDMSKEEQYRSYFYNYPIGRVFEKEKKQDFPLAFHYAFLDSLYGSNPVERENNLERISFMHRKVRFNQKQNASSQLKKVFDEILMLSEHDKDVNKWVKNIRAISTYMNRTVLNMKRQSLHSYGIAVDIMPYDCSKFLYWQWVQKFKEDWWNAGEKDKAQIPPQVIDIFEKNGFIWGGKWYYFDIMHFEYRPEVIRYVSLLKEDPL